MSLSATYYDGRSARRHEVQLTRHGEWLTVRGDGILREEPLSALTIPAALGSAPRLIQFADGARCEVADHAALAELLPTSRRGMTLVAGLEARWSYAIAALAGLLGLIAAGYVWGLPYAATIAAERMPASVLTLMDEQFMKTFDGRLLHPSKLSAERQAALTSRLRAMRWPPDAQSPSRILFRSSDIGPNAFALPGGTVLVLDDLVAIAGNDDEILGVLAHEIGHVSERHALRQMLQASVVGLVLTWYVGDISVVLATAPAALLETRYSREFERRADAFAARSLTLNDIPPSRLGDMLARLEQSYSGKEHRRESGWTDYLSSHPATHERIRALQGPPR